MEGRRASPCATARNKQFPSTTVITSYLSPSLVTVRGAPKQACQPATAKLQMHAQLTCCAQHRGKIVSTRHPLIWIEQQLFLWRRLEPLFHYAIGRSKEYWNNALLIMSQINIRRPESAWNFGKHKASAQNTVKPSRNDSSDYRWHWFHVYSHKEFRPKKFTSDTRSSGCTQSKSCWIDILARSIYDRCKVHERVVIPDIYASAVAHWCLMMPHDASSMAGVSDLAIWNSWRGHAICALRACDPKVSIWRKKKNWTKSGKKGRKCGSLPSQHRLTASCSLTVTQQPSCLKGRLAVTSVSGVFDSVTLWHPVDANVIPEWKPSPCQVCLWVTMSLYVTMYTSEISGSSSTKWGETAMCYPALADLAWKPVNELISAWGHIWKLVHAKMPCSNSFHVKSCKILPFWRKEMKRNLASIQCHTLTFRETGWGTETRRGVPGSTIAHYSPCYIWASWIWIWWLQLVQLPQVNIHLFNPYSRNSAENVLIHIDSYSKLGSEGEINEAVDTDRHRLPLFGPPRAPAMSDRKPGGEKVLRRGFLDFLTFSAERLEVQVEVQGRCFFCRLVLWKLAPSQEERQKCQTAHAIFFHGFAPIKSMKQKWGRMPVHWKEIIKIARPESPENGW